MSSFSPVLPFDYTSPVFVESSPGPALYLPTQFPIWRLQLYSPATAEINQTVSDYLVLVRNIESYPVEPLIDLSQLEN